MKNKLIIFSFLFLFTTSELSFVNSKNISFITKENDNPYIPLSEEATTFSGKSMDIVEQNNYSFISNKAWTFAYVQVIDNANNDYFNYVTNLETTAAAMMSVSLNNGGGVHTEYGIFYPSLSNIKKNQTYYMNFYTWGSFTTIDTFKGEHYATGNSTSDLNNGWIQWEAVNNDPLDVKSQISYYHPNSVYPFIYPYSVNNDDIFKINNLSAEKNELTFTIKVNNWTESTETDYLTEEQNIGVTLVNEDESDEYLKYEQYVAQLTSSNGNYYTYEISGLTPDTNYSFYSINYTGLTIGDTVYAPDADIRLTDELGVPKSYTTIYQEPYIDTTVTDVFQITNIDAKSIEFSLKIIDSYDNFLNHLQDEDNTIDVTLYKTNNHETIKTNATFLKENNDIFTFKITGLNSKTNYKFVSIDNTGLMINGQIDDEILINEDLGIYGSYFTTGSNLAFILIMCIAILLVVVGIVLFIYFYIIKKHKGKIIDKEVEMEF